MRKRYKYTTYYARGLKKIRKLIGVSMLFGQDASDRENKHNQALLEVIVRRAISNGQISYVNVSGIHLHDCVNE